MEAEPGLSITVYTAEPGSPSAEGIELLASWAATNEQQRLAAARDLHADSDDRR